jgi:ribose transport system permease protein
MEPLSSPMVAGSPNRSLGPRRIEPMAEARRAGSRLTAALAGSRFRPSGFFAIWIASGILFALSPLLASGSVDSTALVSMLPFASILAIAAIGQTLVIQQRGLDLSVPGMITLAAVLITKYPNGNADKLPAAVGLVLLACVVSGLVSGVAITRFGITPLVATLGVNALLLGTIYQITGGTATWSATSGLASFAVNRTAGIPNTAIVAGATVLVVAAVMRWTVAGRRFVAVGASPVAARAAGIRVRNYQVATYVLASLAYGAAGILLAGFLLTPNIDAGNSYLLPTIAAVVLGGTSLAGGTGSVVATAMGALFLTQLEQVVLGLGAAESTKLIIQGSIIALGMALRTIPWRLVGSRIVEIANTIGSGLPGARSSPSGPAELPEGSDQ